MLTLKITEKWQLTYSYQQDGWSPDTIKTREPSTKINPNVKDKFDYFTNYMYVSTEKTNKEKQYFFPVFLDPKISIQKNQLDSLLKYALDNIEFFRSKKYIILLIDINEAYSKSERKIVDDLAIKLKNMCRVYLIDGNVKGPEFKYEYTHFSVVHWIHHNFDKPLNEIVSFDSNHKIFISLNRMARCHRVHLLNELIKNKLRNYGFITFSKEVTCCLDWPERYPLVKKAEFDILDFSPNDTLKVNPTQFVPLDYCKKSFLFLNSETYCDTDRLFLTEKTFKPLRLGMPFLTLANSGTLQLLQKKGFQTFSEWIDESYDLIDDEDEKIRIIIQQIHKFARLVPEERIKIRNQMKPILQHNFDLVNKLSFSEPDVAKVLLEIMSKEKI
jgi:hypothetical protein